MYEYIKGALTEATPAYAVIETGGIGYHVLVSVNTYSRIASQREVMLFLHQVVREDAHLLYGFFSKEERALFRLLISVSGIGANTATVMLSSLSVDEIVSAIASENVAAIKRIKGIGDKTAQRVILDLKDKVGRDVGVSEGGSVQAGTIREEALGALVTLGFSRPQVVKTLDKLIASQPIDSVEMLIKQALKLL